ncbi:MAG: glycosyltransferase family 39 protein [Anaerolineae bacterium]|nr:glycosyltransferase family 39 protein [Anaerolineae bacterium]MDQ7036317.1 glycosyltransferase family 39 protein [Anaerolineae bacterium]
MRLSKWFWVLLAIGFTVRLIAAALAPFPGISDPNHYYNLATNLANGRGFVIDYIWQYHNPPAQVTHPIDYWMPLPALWPALGLALFPDNLFAALVPSVIFGTLVIALADRIAAALKADETERLLTMAAVVFLPQYVLNSARTDTTISYIFFMGLTCLFFYQGLRRHPAYLLGAGIFAGLSQLSRQDAIILIPAIVLALLIYRLLADEKGIPWRWLWLIALGWIGVMSPWFIRNYNLYGEILPGGAQRTLFMTSFIDQFTYGRTLDLEHYLDWGLPNILGNIAFQAMANIKTLYTLLNVLLPVTALAGIIGLVRHSSGESERERLRMLILPLTMVLGLFMFYSFVTPFHTMGGSFYKSYQFVIPFLAMASAWGISTFVTSRQAVTVLALLMMFFMLLNAFDTLRLDFAASRRFDDSIAALTVILNEVGDVNGDGEIIIMTQDPYILNYHGFRALMLPSDSRDLILEAAYRYQVDYILLPAARDSLDALYNNAEEDSRLQWLSATGRYQLLAVIPPESAD